MKYTFKHTFTGIKFDIEIESTIPINQLKNLLEQKVKEHLSISNNNYDIIIAGCTKNEFSEAIDLTSIEPIKKLNTFAFYIRPSDFNQIINNLECLICKNSFDLINFNSWTSCSHYNTCCQSCIDNWIKNCTNTNVIPTCPLCRNVVHIN